ncbi:MAG: N-acetyltransferase family protein [Bdellovibrionota bacterium]
MPTQKTKRYWMKIAAREIPVSRTLSFRPAVPEDAHALGKLMDLAYTGTIDHEGESREKCVEEMAGTMGGKYGPYFDFASFLVEENGEALAASLITFWKEKPLLAFSMTAPLAQGQGFGGFLIERSISALFSHGYKELTLVVTAGNAPAERLYAKLGFQALGLAPPGTAAPTS